MAGIDPWGSALVQDYLRLIKDFGLEPFDARMLNAFPEPSRQMRRGVAFAGQGLKDILGVMKSRKPFYVLTGIMPTSERLHFGNKLVIENVRYFQERGARTFVLVADLEAAVTRGVELEDARKRAMDFHIPAYIALGIDPEKTTFYFQSENDSVRNLAYLMSAHVTKNEFEAIYGSTEPGKVFASLTQVGDILYPQSIEKMPGVIPVGIDQSPHIRFSRDLARRTKGKFGFFLPSALYNKFTPSLDGGFKMSKSVPQHYVSIPEEPKSAGRKLLNAFTGGRNTIEEQKRLGGQPEKCVIFELYKQHLVEDDKELQKIYGDCRSGKLLCGEDKQHACRLMETFMAEFNRKLEKARKRVKHLAFAR